MCLWCIFNLQECSSGELFRVIIEHLKYKMVKGTVGEIRSRTLQILKRCGVEMLFIDEADRLKPKSFASCLVTRLNGSLRRQQGAIATS